MITYFYQAIERHIGRERRIQAAAKWTREAAARAHEEMERKSFAEILQRRPSRFEVTPVPTIITPSADSTTSIQSNQLTVHDDVPVRLKFIIIIITLIVLNAEDSTANGRVMIMMFSVGSWIDRALESMLTRCSTHEVHIEKNKFIFSA